MNASVPPEEMLLVLSVGMVVRAARDICARPPRAAPGMGVFGPRAMTPRLANWRQPSIAVWFLLKDSGNRPSGTWWNSVWGICRSRRLSPGGCLRGASCWSG